MTTPSVSIVLPTYNRSVTLSRAIDSILQQTYTDFELIIVDDGSTDATKSKVEEYSDARIRYVYQDNAGASVARNTGIQLARAPYIAFQDSDDEWLLNKLSEQMKVLKTHSSARVVIYTDMLRINANGSAWVLPAPDVVRGRLINSRTADYQTFGVGLQTSIIPRDALSLIGGFDPNLPRFIDLDLFSRLAFDNDFYHLPVPLVKYYETDGITSSFFGLAAARKYLLEKNTRYFSKNPKYWAMQLAFQGDALWKAGRRDEAFQCANDAVRKYPWAIRIIAKWICIRWLRPELTTCVTGCLPRRSRPLACR